MPSPEIIDDKAQHVIPFILSLLSTHSSSSSSSPNPPFIIGLNGVQGAGKSVLVSLLQSTLQSPPHNLPTAVFSLDDLYLTHADQQLLAAANPDNPLLQHRGQPSTHDIPLALSTFSSLRAGLPTKLPAYNKAAHSGAGDRVPESDWTTVNTDPSNPIRVVLFEGWCVGFRPIPASAVAEKHTAAHAALEASQPNPNNHDNPHPYTGRLAYTPLPALQTINTALTTYEPLTHQLSAFIHIDALDPLYVYAWRAEQERSLWSSRGSGMTPAQVTHFVDGYYPSYELYTAGVREGVFRGRDGMAGKQMRLVVGRDRKVMEVIVI